MWGRRNIGKDIFWFVILNNYIILINWDGKDWGGIGFGGKDRVGII